MQHWRSSRQVGTATMSATGTHLGHEACDCLGAATASTPAMQPPAAAVRLIMLQAPHCRPLRLDYLLQGVVGQQR